MKKVSNLDILLGSIHKEAENEKNKGCSYQIERKAATLPNRAVQMDLEQILFLFFSLRSRMQWHIHVPPPESIYEVIVNDIHIL